MPDWRAILAKAGIGVHPAAETLPMLSDKELDGLAGSIERGGLRVMLELWREAEGEAWQLASGRSRCAAMAMLDGGEEMILGAIGCAVQRTGGDPFVLVADLDHRRRHMDSDQRREAIAALLKADPSRSDRSIAKQVSASPTYVGSVRKVEEHAGTVSTVDTRVGSDGVAQPATKAQPKPAAQPKPDKPYPHDPPGVVRIMPPVRPETEEEHRAREAERMHSTEQSAEPADRVRGWVKKLQGELDYFDHHPELAAFVPEPLRLALQFVGAVGLTPEELERFANSVDDGGAA